MAFRDLIPGKFTLAAVAFEFALGLLALALGRFLNCWPLATVDYQAPGELVRAALCGALVAIPLLAGTVLADRYPIGILAELKQAIQDVVVPLFRQTSAPGLVAIAIAAGVGEELLFRGFLQAILADSLGAPWGPWIALVVAALVFGIVHWLCAVYALLATLIGLVLGLLFMFEGNLVAPIMTHALYDTLALFYLVRWAPGPARA